MMRNQSPNGKSVGSTSIDSVKNWENKVCFCGRNARISISWTLQNPGRGFFTCAKPKLCINIVLVVKFL